MDTGRRARKREETRRHIATTAARLFAERGFEQVAVVDVARAADVAEQTVYNYFPTKEHLVLDEDEALRGSMVAAVRDRAVGTSPAAALRPVAEEFAASAADQTPAEMAGGLGALAAVSPAVRRLSLAMTDRHADAVAEAIAATSPGLGPDRARLQAVALAWVFQAITDASGRAVGAGLTPEATADRLRALVSELFDDLEGWPA